MPPSKQIVFLDTTSSGTTPDRIVSSNSQDKIVSTLVSLGFAPFVDGTHGFEHTWYLNNVAPCPHKLYTVDFSGNRLIEYEVADLPNPILYKPDLVLYFNQDEEVTSSDWYSILQWLRFHLLQHEVDAALLEEANAFMVPPPKQIVGLKQDEEDVVVEEEEKNCYTFVSQYLGEDDIMLYQVCKPFTDLPYTSVVREFSKKGHTRFFSSLFVCPSWGVSRFDVPFLEHVWKHRLEMDGIFNMDDLLREATEACYPGEGGSIPEPEPEVYRRSMEEVVVTLANKKKGIECGVCHDVPAHLTHESGDSVDEDVDMF